MIGPIMGVTLRALLGRRRTLLMLLLTLTPVLIAVLVRVAGRPPDPVQLSSDLLDTLVVGAILPLAALIFGTAALGSELDDGTAVYLLTKPIPRWQIVAAKVTAAAGLTILFVVPAAIVSGLLIAGDQDGGVRITLAYAAGAIVAAVVYSTLFVALSTVTSRALIVGLIYALLWEGLLAGLFAGTRILSVREYALGIAATIDGSGRIDAGLDTISAVGLAAVVFVALSLLAVERLSSYEVRSGD